MKSKPVYISDLHVQCSLRVRNKSEWGLAMSDCCGRAATNGVTDGEGSVWWRCRTHTGWLLANNDGDVQEYGHVVTQVARNV